MGFFPTLIGASILFAAKFTDVVTSIISAIISSVISSLTVAFILNHMLAKQREIGRKLSQEGIKSVRVGKKGISSKDWGTLLNLTKKNVVTQMDVCFLTGRGFLISNDRYLQSVAEKVI